jgi:hypothetical protein
MNTRARSWSVAIGTATLAAACNQMLGIEDAKVDGRLGSLGQGSTSSAGSATAGMSGGGGSAGAAQGGSAGLSGTGGHDHQSASGAGGSDVGSAGSDDTPEPGRGGTGGTSSPSMGGTHSGSGSAGKGSDDHGGAAGDDNSVPSADPCDDYCDEMQSECTGEAEQYHDRAQCMTICHFFPLGDEDEDDDDNSVACRLKYVKKTQYGLGAEVTNYCRQAGPSGDGTCGTSCEAFCSVMMEVCTTTSAGANHFESTAACLEACNALPAPTVHYSDMDPAVSDGNHALCRLFHVNSAAMADAEEHCEHAMGITLCQATP